MLRGGPSVWSRSISPTVLAAATREFYGAAASAGSTSDAQSALRSLGRSQVVRQRILIPPFGGSNPPAPAFDYFLFCPIQF